METFQERARLHLKASIQDPLEAGRCIIITHATRGAIPGLTTRILSWMQRRTGLVDAPLVHHMDAPHGPNGYALPHSATKRRLIVESLEPLKACIETGLREGRILISGKIAQHLVARCIGDERLVKKYSIPHPCRWLLLRTRCTLVKLHTVLGHSTPNVGDFARMLVWAQSQTVIARWARMTDLEKEVYALERKAAYAALPPEEKARRANEAAAAYAALPPEEKERRTELARTTTSLHWKTVSPVEKLRRVRFMHMHRRTPAGRRNWRAALKEAKARMSPEVRAAVSAAMRAGYKRKMTPARQAEVGAKRRLAWTPEMRQGAAIRGLANADISRQNMAKAHETLRTEEGMAKRNRKRRATYAEAGQARVRAAIAKVDAGEALVCKKARRSLRETCQKALDAKDAGKLDLAEADVELFRKGIEVCNAAGKETKSAKLKLRHSKS